MDNTDINRKKKKQVGKRPTSEPKEQSKTLFPLQENFLEEIIFRESCTPNLTVGGLVGKYEHEFTSTAHTTSKTSVRVLEICLCCHLCVGNVGYV